MALTTTIEDIYILTLASIRLIKGGFLPQRRLYASIFKERTSTQL